MEDNSNIMDKTGPIVQADSTTVSESSVALMLYSKLDEMFGNGSQLFVMESPGRVLNQFDYAYPLEDYNSSILRKPYAVAENEFRLCDNMFDLSAIVQGPNGVRLSDVYNTVINNYTPKIDDIKNFIIDKMQLRLFLLETITDDIDGETVTCSRMEFCQRLYMNYLLKKYQWDQEKAERHKNSKDDMDEYSKWLATVSWTKDKDMERLFNDAVIRGFYHEIMTILGFLDIQSPAERLAAAKQNRRSSVRRSMDDSMDILPVRLQPSNWFRALTPNFSPQDLTLGMDYLELEYKTKKNLLSSLEAELRVLLTRTVGSQDISALEHEVAQLKTEMLESETSFYEGFTRQQIDAIQMALEIVSKGDVLSFIFDEKGLGSLSDMLSSTNFGSLIGIVSDVGKTVKKLLTNTVDLYKANSDYFKAYDKLIQTQLALTAARTSSHNEQIELLKERIRILSKEVAQLETVIMSGFVHGKGKSSAQTASDTQEEDSLLLPIARYNDNTEFMDLVFTKSQVKETISGSNTSMAMSLRSKFNTYFAGGDSNMEASLSNSAFFTSLMASDFTLGLRVMKVTIDRGGWFDPGILDLTGAYFHLDNGIAAGAGLNPADIKEGQFSSTPVEPKYLLPAFPMSFLIVKDVVLKSTLTEYSNEDYKKFREITSSSSTSMFGMRTSGGFAAQSYMEVSEKDADKNVFYMKIPGPQIIGWFMELPKKDVSGPYESLSQSDYFTTMIEELKQYSDRLKELTKDGDENMVDVKVSTIKVPVI